MRTELVVDSPNKVLHDRSLDGRLAVHSDRGSQYLGMRYTERLDEAGAVPSIGSGSDAYDDALVERVIAVFKSEIFRQRGPWRDFDDVGYATLDWVTWFHRQRLLEPLDYLRPA